MLQTQERTMAQVAMLDFCVCVVLSRVFDLLLFTVAVLSRDIPASVVTEGPKPSGLTGKQN